VIAQAATVAELPLQVVVCLPKGLRIAAANRARHAQVHNHRAHLAKRHEQVLASALAGCERLAHDAIGQGGINGPAQPTLAHRHGHELVAHSRLFNATSGGLNFW